MAILLFLGSSQLALTQEAEFQIVVHEESFAFDPPVVVLEVGDMVTWVNEDTRRHLMSSIPGTGPTDELEIFCPKFFPGKTCSNTFTLPGKYPYFCFIHRKMMGEVIVLEK